MATAPAQVLRRDAWACVNQCNLCQELILLGQKAAGFVWTSDHIVEVENTGAMAKKSISAYANNNSHPQYQILNLIIFIEIIERFFKHHMNIQ